VALAGDDETTEEATLKRLFKEDGRVRLQPENDALEPIYAQHVQLIHIFLLARDKLVLITVVAWPISARPHM